MDAHAAMTAFYFDALRYVGRLLPTALPSAHTIGSAEYRSSWYGGRLGHRGSETRIYILRTLPAYVLIKLPRIGRPRIAGEWASERNYLPHAFRNHLRELASIESAQAPSDQTDFAALTIVQLVYEINHTLFNPIAKTIVPPLPPSAYLIASRFEEMAEGPRRGVGSNKAW